MAKVGSPGGRRAGLVLPSPSFSPSFPPSLRRGVEVRPANQVLRVAGPGDRQHVGKAEGSVPAPHDAAAARGWHWRGGRLVTPPPGLVLGVPGAPSGAFPRGWGCLRCCSASLEKLSGLNKEDNGVRRTGFFVHVSVSGCE